MRLRHLALLTLLFYGCDDGGEAGETATDAGTEDGSSPGEDGGEVDEGLEPDAGAPPLSLDSVSGDLTFATLGAQGHLFSLQSNGGLQQRLTTTPGHWGFHSVGPDPRWVVAQKGEEVWIVDVREHDEYPISPEGCVAGTGGVGWRDEVRVLFAMSCDGEPSEIFMASRDNRARDRAALLQVTEHEGAARDVFPAVSTSVFAYVVDVQVCVDECVLKPQVWIGDLDTMSSCQLTDGGQNFTDIDTITTSNLRLGDHQPSFEGALSSVMFSRNVGDKPAGPEGHHDMMSVGIDRQALFAGAATCATDSLVNLSDIFLNEEYQDARGNTVVGDERYPQPSAGRAPPNTVLYTAQTHEGEGTSVIYLVDAAGNRTPLTRGKASYAKWIVTDYNLSGER